MSTQPASPPKPITVELTKTRTGTNIANQAKKAPMRAKRKKKAKPKARKSSGGY